MKQPRTKVAQLIADRTLKKGRSRRLAEEIAAYLLAERRVNDLDSILRDVQADWAAAGQVEVLARSAHELDQRTKADIAKRLKPLYPKAKQVIVTPVYDPEIIGGVRLNLADRQLDLSIQSKLAKFKQAAMAGKE